MSKMRLNSFLTFDAAVAAIWSWVVRVIRSGTVNLSCSFEGGGCLGGVMP